MNQDWMKQLISDAENVLAERSEPVVREGLERSRREDLCATLLKAFAKSCDMHFFEGFYSLSFPLFKWFANRQLNMRPGKKSVEKLLNSMYSVVCESALQPGSAVPYDNLFYWCYALIDNLLENDPGTGRAKCLSDEGGAADGVDGFCKDSEFEMTALCPSLVEAYGRVNRMPEDERVFEGIHEALITNDADLSEIELRALSLYDSRVSDQAGMIAKIASEIGISEERAGKLLDTVRDKVMRCVFSRESGRFLMNGEEDLR